MTNFEKVKKFMETFGQEVKSKPSFSSKKINDLRYNLIKEELDELKQAIEKNDLLEVADALIMYLPIFLSKSLFLTLTIAAAFFTIAIDWISIGLTKKSPISKYLFDLWVDAPQYLSSGTLMDPMLSYSFLVFI